MQPFKNIYCFKFTVSVNSNTIRFISELIIIMLSLMFTNCARRRCFMNDLWHREVVTGLSERGGKNTPM